MEAMKEFPDNHFDLAIVDPPYGIGITKSQRLAVSRGMGGKSWDNEAPSLEYFDEIRRVSRNQIIWGWNYFVEHLTPCKCFLMWDKNNYGRDFADCEQAWTSFDSVARIFKMRPMNMDGGKIHPTQKPVKLYKWLLKNYAESGQKILDTHLGSMSIAIACHDYKCHLTGFEIDEDYFRAGTKRVQNHVNQLQLF